MKLKCIGGPNHNERCNVPNDYREGDMVRLVTYPKISINEIAKIESTTIDYNFYILETLRYKEKDRADPTEFKFLRFKDISFSEAIRIALVY